MAILIFYSYDQQTEESIADLLELSLASDIECVSRDSVFVSGFPVGFMNLKQILPQSDAIENAATKINEGFHYFRNQVIAEGPMTVTDSGLAELELSSTLGMSGSPIFVKNDSRFEVIGIYCGGPPLPGQRELIKIIKLVMQDDIKIAYERIKTVPFADGHLFNYSPKYMAAKTGLKNLIYSISDRQEREKMRDRFEDEEVAAIDRFNDEELGSFIADTKYHVCDGIVNLVQESLMNYKNSQEICFNSGISIRARVFDYVRNVKSFFSDLSGNFNSAKELEGQLWFYLLNRS